MPARRPNPNPDPNPNQVDEAEALLLRALKEHAFAETAESVCHGHSNSMRNAHAQCPMPDAQCPMPDAR